MTPRLPPQLVRLLAVTIGIVAIYLVARHFLTPISFGQYGWYRGAAITELASHNRSYAGGAACVECHADQAQQLAAGGHKSLACEVCHGPGQAHADDPDVKPAILHFRHCVRCHEGSPAKPAWMKQVEAKTHYAGDACTECHPPHKPIE